MGNMHFIPTKNAKLADLWSTTIDQEPIDIKVELLAEMLSQFFYACYLGLNPTIGYVLLECQTNEFASDFAERLRNHPSFEGLIILLNDPATCKKTKYFGSDITTRSIIGITIRLKPKIVSQVVPQSSTVISNDPTISYAISTSIPEPEEYFFNFRIE
jgi:hypothetical protein